MTHQCYDQDGDGFRVGTSCQIISDSQDCDDTNPNITIECRLSDEISRIAAKIRSPLSEEGVTALGKLATIGTKESVQVLIDKVVTLDEFKAKSAYESGLISVFAQIENPESTYILVNKLKTKTSGHEFLVPGIIRALGNIGNKEATDALIKFAQIAYEEEADYATIQQEYYFSISNSKYLPSLLAAAKNDKLFWEIRVQSLNAISKIALTDNIDNFTADVLPTLEKIIDDPSTFVRVRRAAERVIDIIKNIDQYKRIQNGSGS